MRHPPTEEPRKGAPTVRYCFALTALGLMMFAGCAHDRRREANASQQACPEVACVEVVPRTVPGGNPCGGAVQTGPSSAAPAVAAPAAPVPVVPPPANPPTPKLLPAPPAVLPDKLNKLPESGPVEHSTVKLAGATAPEVVPIDKP